MKYRLQKDSIAREIEQFINRTDDKTHFVCHLAEGGSSIGVLNKSKIAIIPSRIMSKLFIFGPNYYVKQIFENFKKDKTRVQELATSIENESSVKMTLSDIENSILNLKDYRDSLSSVEPVQSAVKDNGKRLALNNGIFKPENQNEQVSMF